MTTLLSFKVKNFGPIKETEQIDIKPLTIFIGPNASGKSYLALLAKILIDMSTCGREKVI